MTAIPLVARPARGILRRPEGMPHRDGFAHGAVGAASRDAAPRSRLQSTSSGWCVPVYSANNAVTPHGFGVPTARA